LIYLDSSALVKLAVTEPESAALADWLRDSSQLARVSSPLVRVDVPRAVWRADPGSLPQAYTIVRRLREIRMTEAVLTRAAGVRPNVLRTLDGSWQSLRKTELNPNLSRATVVSKGGPDVTGVHPDPTAVLSGNLRCRVIVW
jgi:hypothetical protein